MQAEGRQADTQGDPFCLAATPDISGQQSHRRHGIEQKRQKKEDISPIHAATP